MSYRLNTRFRFAIPAALTLVVGVALAGCGGGGGDDNGGGGPTNDNTVLGKVVDTQGFGVPGANVIAVPTGNSPLGGLQATTLTDGGYRITSLDPGTYTVSASTTINGTSYTGSTQALVTSHSIISNAVIELAPPSQQGVIEGTITDTSGRPLSGVRVLASVSVTPAQGTTQTSGLQAITDNNGFYQFPKVPTATAPYQLTATALGYVNATTTVSSLTTGQTQTRNFQLSQSFNGSVPTPTNVLAASLTQPSSVLTPSIASHARTSAATSSSDIPTSVYDTIRKVMSPKYAQWSANRHLASGSTRLKSHVGGFSNYAIEADVFFSESQISNVAGYRIYNSEGSQTVQAYDFLQDPQASLYVDLDPFYVPDTQFNFAVSAINTDNTESGISNTASFDPLELEVVTSPVQGQVVHNPLSVSWQSVQGATQYGVFIYNTYPSIGSTPVVQATGLSASTTTYFLTTTLAPGNYWAIVSAADTNSIDVSVSQIVEFQVQ
jgi:hypothetical protein